MIIDNSYRTYRLSLQLQKKNEQKYANSVKGPYKANAIPLMNNGWTTEELPTQGYPQIIVHRSLLLPRF